MYKISNKKFNIVQFNTVAGYCDHVLTSGFDHNKRQSYYPKIELATTWSTNGSITCISRPMYFINASQSFQTYISIIFCCF